MTGLLNQNFLLGFLLARDLGQQESVTVGLAASQMRERNLIGPVLLKPLIDARREAGERADKLDRQIEALRRPARIRPRFNTEGELQLEVSILDSPDATWRISGPPDSSIKFEPQSNGTARITFKEFTNADKEATLIATIGGIDREIRVSHPSLIGFQPQLTRSEGAQSQSSQSAGSQSSGSQSQDSQNQRNQAQRGVAQRTTTQRARSQRAPAGRATPPQVQPSAAEATVTQSAGGNP